MDNGASFTIQGKYGEAVVHASTVDDTAMSQILSILNHPMSGGAHTRIMADVHAGVGCVIGYTARLTGMVVPNVVGVDIGCGVTGIPLVHSVDDIKEFDDRVHSLIPTGPNTYAYGGYELKGEIAWENQLHRMARHLGFDDRLFNDIHAVCKETNQDYDRVLYALGTLGGGNHFLEIDVDSAGGQWFVVHSGSRNFGYRIASHWQNVAVLHGGGRKQAIERIRRECTGKEIERRIKELPTWPKDMAYLEGDDMRAYLRHADVARRYAEFNRMLIVHRLFSGKHYDRVVTSTHNYVDVEHGIVRKGAISAQSGEELLIPLNMRDGCIYGKGRGNPEYNFSAPHGAGRKMGRSEAKRALSLDDFKVTMAGIYSTCVCDGTLDESPMAYKDAEDILANIRDTVDVLDIMKPIWNFKAIE